MAIQQEDIARHSVSNRKTYGAVGSTTTEERRRDPVVPLASKKVVGVILGYWQFNRKIYQDIFCF